jgi:SAM-dependent methyltransferase
MTFVHPGDSHRHSLETLNRLYEYDDFMSSIKTVLDLGCGTGDDLAWWATRTTRDEESKPLNIRCTGVDLCAESSLTKRYNNVFYQANDFETVLPLSPGATDVLWCHDSFQYAQSPVETLSRWWQLGSPGAMLYIAVPVTQRIHRNQLDYYLPTGCYYHYTMVNLIYMLATAGWDCQSGFFKQAPLDPWIHAVVYKSNHTPLNPKTTSWHTLSELNLLPESAARSVFSHNYLRQQDLVVPWLDHSLLSMAIQ